MKRCRGRFFSCSQARRRRKNDEVRKSCGHQFAQVPNHENFTFVHLRFWGYWYSIFDLTSEQIGDEKPDYTDCPEQERAVHFAKTEKKERYELLKERLFAARAERTEPVSEYLGRTKEL